MINVILVDNHEMARYGAKCILKNMADARVVGEAANGDSALGLVREFHPEIVLLDLKLPGISAIEVTRKILLINYQTKIIIMNASNDSILARYALQAGALGYLTDTVGPEQLIYAIRKVCNGQAYITPEVAQNMATRQMNGGDGNPIDKLSIREMEVVLLILQGFNVKEIAARLYLSPKTINTYRYRVFGKLDLKNNVELLRLATQCGILDRETTIGNTAIQ